MRGDGIGPEIVSAALSVLEEAYKELGISVEYEEVVAGDNALKDNGSALPQKSIDAFARSDACLKGPVGESIMEINMKLRFGFDLYANLRPVISYAGIFPPALSPDMDAVIIRENSEGFYRAIESEIEPDIWTATGVFTRAGASRIAEFAFSYASRRLRYHPKEAKVTLATKANIFRKTHGMYLDVFREIAGRYTSIRFEHLYADALCANLVRQPSSYDIIVSENLLADLLSDLAGQAAGGLGMTPGTNINYETKHAYFEPTHGSAPDIVGKGLANPIGQIRAGGLMLEYLGFIYDDHRLSEAARTIESAIGRLLNSPDRLRVPRELGGRADARTVAEGLVSLMQEHAQQ